MKTAHGNCQQYIQDAAHSFAQDNSHLPLGCIPWPLHLGKARGANVGDFSPPTAAASEGVPTLMGGFPGILETAVKRGATTNFCASSVMHKGKDHWIQPLVNPKL